MVCLAASLAWAARLVLLGDTGVVASETARAALDAGRVEACQGPAPVCELAQLMRAVRADAAEADAVVVLGDNYYGAFPGLEPSPGCRGPGPRLDAVLARYRAWFDGLSPVVAVLGNHDVGHGLWGWRRRETCAKAAMAELGWLPPGGVGVVRVGDGVLRAVDTNPVVTPWLPDPRRVNAPALAPVVGSAWELWVGHHAWSLAYEKGRQPAKLRRVVRDWGVRPRVWVNGHAHHLEAGVEEGVLAITSGSGSKVRDLDPAHPGPDPPDRLLYACGQRGYTVLEITSGTATVSARGTRGEALHEVRCAWGDDGWTCARTGGEGCG